MKCRWGGASLMVVYVVLPCGLYRSDCPTLCPTGGDRSGLVGGAVSYRHAGENDK